MNRAGDRGVYEAEAKGRSVDGWVDGQGGEAERNGNGGIVGDWSASLEIGRIFGEPQMGNPSPETREWARSEQAARRGRETPITRRNEILVSPGSRAGKTEYRRHAVRRCSAWHPSRRACTASRRVYPYHRNVRVVFSSSRGKGRKKALGSWELLQKGLDARGPRPLPLSVGTSWGAQQDEGGPVSGHRLGELTSWLR